MIGNTCIAIAASFAAWATHKLARHQRIRRRIRRRIRAILQ